MWERGRKILPKLLLAASAPLVFFGGLELVATLMGVPPLAGERQYEFHVRQRSCRTEFAAARELCDPSGLNAAGRKLVVTLGGSTVYGYPKEHVVAFPEQLQELLDASFPGEYEVANRGFSCKTSVFVEHCAQLLVAADPFAFVIYAGHNDYNNWQLENPGLQILLERHAWVYELERPLSYSRLFSAMARRWDPREVAPEARWPDVSDGQAEDARAVILAEFERNLASVLSRSAERGIQVLLVTIASNLHYPIHPSQWDDPPLAEPGEAASRTRWRGHYFRAVALQRDGGFEAALREFKAARDERYMGRAPRELNRKLRELSEKHPGSRLVDFAAELDAVGAREGLGCQFFGSREYCDQFHPNTRTHRMIAQAVFRELARLRELGSSGPAP